MEKMKLTGIAIGYDNNLIYECSDEKVGEFRAFLEPSELKRVDKVNAWYDIGDRSVFLRIEPKFMQDCNDEWIATGDDLPEFSFRHDEGRNLLDELEDRIAAMLKTSPLANSSHTDAPVSGFGS